MRDVTRTGGTQGAAAQSLEVPGYEHVWRVPCSRSVAFLALHASVDGRAFGGIRIRAYPSEDAARDDALALSRAMSAKLALAEVRGGGAKTVLMLPEPDDRAAAVAALGAFIESLGGGYCCGPDLGFTPEDDAVLRRATGHMSPDRLAGVTARGVEIALRAACPRPARVAVQGLGSVGAPLARSLAAAGVDVLASDLAPAVDLPGVTRVAADAILRQEVDVLSPCAVGGTLDAATIPELRCRWICGGANNPLASEADGVALQRRGIVLVPDVLSTSGAVIVGASLVLGEEALIEQRLQAIGPRVRELLALAEREGLPPTQVAARLADERLAALRGG